MVNIRHLLFSIPNRVCAPMLVMFVFFSIIHSTFMYGSTIILYIAGFRLDYLNHTPNLIKLCFKGSTFPLRPVFPNHVLPNLYSLATGYPPDVHQIFADQMQFRIGEKDQKKMFKDNCCQKDSWWWYADERAIPLWIKARWLGHLHIKAINVPGACSWFADVYAENCIKFKQSNNIKYVMKQVRKEQLRNGWRFTVAYLSEPYATAIKYGAHSKETLKKLNEIDKEVSKALNGLHNCTNVMIVSAGSTVDIRRRINLSEYTNLKGWDVMNGLGVTQLYSQGPGAFYDKKMLPRLNKGTSGSGIRPFTVIDKHTNQTYWTKFWLKPRLADLWLVSRPGNVVFKDEKEIRKYRKIVAASGYDVHNVDAHGILVLFGPMMPAYGLCRSVSIIDAHDYIHKSFHMVPDVHVVNKTAHAIITEGKFCTRINFPDFP